TAFSNYYVGAGNRGDTSQNGSSVGNVAYPKAFPCFGVIADEGRHDSYLRRRGKREQQTKGCKGQKRFHASIKIALLARQEEAPKLKQSFHILALGTFGRFSLVAASAQVGRFTMPVRLGLARGW